MAAGLLPPRPQPEGMSVDDYRKHLVWYETLVRRQRHAHRSLIQYLFGKKN